MMFKGKKQEKMKPLTVNFATSKWIYFVGHYLTTNVLRPFCKFTFKWRSQRHVIFFKTPCNSSNLFYFNFFYWILVLWEFWLNISNQWKEMWSTLFLREVVNVILRPENETNQESTALTVKHYVICFLFTRKYRIESKHVEIKSQE